MAGLSHCFHRRAVGSMSRVLAAAVVAAAIFDALPATAGESPFGYVYTTDTHPRGQLEFEQWATLRTGKPHGDYNLWQLREEIEYGVTNNFQLSGYVNWLSVSAFRDKVDGTTGGAFVPESADPNKRYSSTRFDSVSLEGIYRLLSPYKDPIGLALYLEPSIGPDVREIETKLLLHKNFLEDRLVLASNFIVAWEWEHKSGDPTLDPSDPGASPRWQKDLELEFTAGATYQVAQNWYAGLEFRNHNVFTGHSLNHQEFTSFFAGPTVHYTTEGWWATLTVLPQLPLAQAYNDDQKAALVHDRIYSDDHEQMEIRLRAGITF
ncbi:MAG TPA: DUF6662 family protein [Alphaproteobacteria bacterium]